MVFLPDERQPRPDILSSMSQPKRKQHSAFGVHPGDAWGQLASRGLGRLQEGDRVAQCGAGRVDEVRVVHITPLRSTGHRTKQNVISDQQGVRKSARKPFS